MVAWVVAAIFSVKDFESFFCMACLIFNKIMVRIGAWKAIHSLNLESFRAYIELILSRTQMTIEYGVIDKSILRDMKGHSRIGK